MSQPELNEVWSDESNYTVYIKESSLYESILESNRLTQVVMSGLYYIGYSYYLESDSCVTKLNLFFSLLSFLFSILVADYQTLQRVSPTITIYLCAFPGLLECISFLFAVQWMVCSLSWYLQFPDAVASTVLIDSLPYGLSTIAFVNWMSWTASFMF